MLDLIYNSGHSGIPHRFAGNQGPAVTVIVQGEPKSGALGGKINGGGADLVLRASSGGIVIKK
jgi:hypothetical protein